MPDHEPKIPEPPVLGLDDYQRLVEPKPAAELAGGFHHLSLKRIPDFPKPVRLSATKNAYVLGEILDWIERRKAQREAA